MLLLTLALAVGATSVAYVGYARGGDAMADMMLNNPERSAQVWQREIVMQRQFLHRLDRSMEADLSALAGSVGRIEAELTRLDAVAERVVKTTKLDPEEFDLRNPPAMGGPHSTRSNPPQWDELLHNLTALRSEIELRDARLGILESLMLDKQMQDDMQPTGQPVHVGWISSGYGYRTDPVSGRREFHDGVDFAGKAGQNVRAAAAGVVTWSGKRWGYGNLVEINHGNGYITRYAHNRANLVSIGEKVEKNQAVALLGATGRATGPHVHFEVVHDNQTINPWKFMNQDSGRDQHAARR